MAKKINMEQTQEDALRKISELGAIIRDGFTMYENVSVMRVAKAAEVSYDKLRNASKLPIVGEVYDPKALNFNAMAQVLGAEKVENLDFSVLNDPTPTRSTITVDLDKYEVGQTVYLRAPRTEAHKVIYKTPTHIVLDNGKEGAAPVVWSNATFLAWGPLFQPRPVKASAQEVEGEAKPA
jgi:hypothetical protein